MFSYNPFSIYNILNYSRQQNSNVSIHIRPQCLLYLRDLFYSCFQPIRCPIIRFLDSFCLAYYKNYYCQLVMKKRECFIPQRQVNWKKYAYLHNRANNIYYDCECGKRYVSFPAIYLHFQRKHSKKLSTRQEPPQCQIRKTDKQLVYFYFVGMKRQYSEISPQKQFPEQNTQSLAEMRSVFKDFLKNNEQSLIKYTVIPFAEKILESLEYYVYQNGSKENKFYSNEQQLMFNLPNYFNGFALAQLQEGAVQKEQYNIVCIILFVLSKWLNKKNLSSLIVEFN